MDHRLELHELLCSILGSRNVYYQPPESIKMGYPCIIYFKDYAKTTFADNVPYINKTRYQVIYIDSDPDNSICEKLSQLPMCLFDRHYISDNLNHDAYKLYF